MDWGQVTLIGKENQGGTKTLLVLHISLDSRPVRIV